MQYAVYNNITRIHTYGWRIAFVLSLFVQYSSMRYTHTHTLHFCTRAVYTCAICKYGLCQILSILFIHTSIRRIRMNLYIYNIDIVYIYVNIVAEQWFCLLFHSVVCICIETCSVCRFFVFFLFTDTKLVLYSLCSKTRILCLFSC